ncbi:uncharacterized protein LOC116146827 isoform X1 [Pistacia vera]|uniref:uncharacterized protein LOC116146827 isoform X1 n=1 Tax=Pistacia vera TaxID=55513 RepID=UPI001263BBDE|nr:uncharacterized protein LOC116146827 isoform X1 [Pistacia vera]
MTASSLLKKYFISKQKKKLRSRQKKLKAYDLSSLSEFLPELKSPQQPIAATDFKLNCKSRKKLMFVLHFIILRLKEGKQLSTVLNHPAFQVDPLAAIHQHLESTAPVSDEKPKKKTSKTARKKKKGDKSKTSSEPQSMDF